MPDYNPPFPWFGGKSRIAGLVWERLGKVEHYVEPFFGSGAVLFANPNPPTLETVNDKDHLIANFWRAVQRDPEAVAHHADNPVNEDDLTARHIWLVKHGIPDLDRRIMADPEYFDPKIAGWWCWGLCCWIGSGWCAGNGPWTEEDGILVKGKPGVNRQLPHLGTKGAGVNRPPGVNRKRPHLMNSGVGVNRPQTHLVEYFNVLAERLRNVRVCAGDWARVVTDGALARGTHVGIFLDPPYSAKTGRDMSCYRTDSGNVAREVLEWCIEHGNNPRYRIALAGYAGEHDELVERGWRVVAWTAGRAYGRANGETANGETANSENRKLERVWFSPGCVLPGTLF